MPPDCLFVSEMRKAKEAADRDHDGGGGGGCAQGEGVAGGSGFSQVPPHPGTHGVLQK